MVEYLYNEGNDPIIREFNAKNLYEKVYFVGVSKEAIMNNLFQKVNTFHHLINIDEEPKYLSFEEAEKLELNSFPNACISILSGEGNFHYLGSLKQGEDIN